MYLFCIYFVFPLYLAQARSRQWECEWARWPGGSCGTASPSLAGGKTAWREPPPSFLSLPLPTLPSPWGHTVSGGAFPVSEWSERQRTRVFTHILWHFAKRCSAKSRRVAPQCNVHVHIHAQWLTVPPLDYPQAAWVCPIQGCESPSYLTAGPWVEWRCQQLSVYVSEWVCIPTMATVTTRTPLKDSEGLILPKKLLNPCLESRSVKDLHREIKWNKKA